MGARQHERSERPMAWAGIARTMGAFLARGPAAAFCVAVSIFSMPLAAQAADDIAALCVEGTAIEVFHLGEWYRAKVLEGPDSGTCLISYDGYDASWDEWVEARRMRALASAAGGSAQAIAAAIPQGTYNCYTLNGGTLVYTYTDVHILDANRYRIGDAKGEFALSEDGKVGFSGPMANATGRFSIKSTGTPQIDLVFNEDEWASMACSRAE